MKGKEKKKEKRRLSDNSHAQDKLSCRYAKLGGRHRSVNCVASVQPKTTFRTRGSTSARAGIQNPPVLS